jgi:aromatic ring-opening dioxygenase catalytic subunit (LigB family)
MPSSKLATLFIPHGGGPCFFMDWTPMGPKDTWDRIATFLRGLDASLPSRPKALLVVSGHWEAPVATVTSSLAPPLIYDYSGFPAHTYALTWPAPGAPELAAKVQRLLGKAGIDSAADATRGFDHGVFVPLKVAYPEAQVPTVQLSLRAGLDPASHLAMGRALASLRDEGVLIVGSGMSYHNMRALRTPGALEPSARFDAWLTQAVCSAPPQRDHALAGWASAPAARESHPREEHLMPLLVAAGAAQSDAGRSVLRDEVMGAVVSAFAFGS